MVTVGHNLVHKQTSRGDENTFISKVIDFINHHECNNAASEGSVI